MDVVFFTRQLVDIESITGNEAAVGEALHAQLTGMGALLGDAVKAHAST